MRNHEELIKKKEQSLLGGGIEKINKQHQQGKLTARERIEVLLDRDSFEEYGVYVEQNQKNLVEMVL